jgi:hypothetical protein
MLENIILKNKFYKQILIKFVKTYPSFKVLFFYNKFY